MKSLVLSGTPEQLKSVQAHNIIAAACHAGLPLKLTSERTIIVSPTPPSVGAALSYGNEISIGTTNAALRLLGRLAPHLLGESDVTAGLVDGWLSFGSQSLDLAIQVRSDEDFNRCLVIVQRHLLHRTYLVGDSVTAADVRLIVSLYAAAQQGFWKPLDDTNKELDCVLRWYNTLVHQDWFQQSVQTLSSGQSRTAASSAVVAGASDGVLLNGSPPSVLPAKYRRHRIRIKEVLLNGGADLINQTITVAGWARTIRKASSKLLFVELNDGSTGASLQCVLDSATTANFDECTKSGGTGASFQFIGTIVSSVGQEQAVDMKVTEAKLLGAVYGGNVEGTQVGGMLYPLSKKGHTLEHLRDHAHLRARGQIHAAAMRVRHAMAYATHHFFNSHGFLYIHTPILTGADCEGAGEQFGVTTLLGADHLKPDIVIPLHPLPEEKPVEEKQLSKSEQKRLAKKKAKEDPNKEDPSKPHEEIVPGAVDYSKDFFGQRVNLTVSGQLNVETHACSLSDVYTFGPTFRAEESRTYRHLSEFWMIEPEIAFADLQDDINLAEDYLKYCVTYALENCADDLEFFENSPFGEAGLRDRLRNVLDNEFKRLTYTEAIEILQKAVAEGVQFEVKPEWGIDLPSEHERYICEKVFNKPVVLTDYPKDIKAFYMKLNDDGKTVAAADVLVPKIGEIIGGSQREHRLDLLRQRCIDMNLDPRSVWWYLDLRRYGTIPHAGFGLGFERLLLFVTGLDNIRDVIPFPRWVGNAKF